MCSLQCYSSHCQQHNQHSGWNRLEGNWCKYILGLPGSKCDEIYSQYSTEEERARAVVREWLLRDPLASWRRIIDELYHCGETKYDILGDSILHYAEDLIGMYI